LSVVATAGERTQELLLIRLSIHSLPLSHSGYPDTLST
jgi:hypothetical protein